MTAPSEQSNLQCPTCAGQRRFDPPTQRLSCDSCGNGETIEHCASINPAQETPYNPGQPSDDPQSTVAVAVHRCETCGGGVTFVGAALSERCAYCNGPVVLEPQDTEFATMALIPFQIDQDDTVPNVARWVSGRLAAPSDLADAVAKGKTAALYAPFFTLDSSEAISYWGSYRVKRGKRTVVKQTSGNFTVFFDDLLVPASPHITPLIRDGVIHDFNPGNLKPYDPAYLAGFGAERHHMTVAEGMEANRDDKAVLIRNRIQQHSHRHLSNIRFTTDSSHIRYRRILLPVYILHYAYKGKAYKIVSCGLRGTTYGERPFSRVKLFLYSLAISAAALALGIAYGAAGLP
ncbi:hypothetical protein [Shimia ponticola]|uniref:hypothetical protein n=1 Tax=Shimia ponticola TaxID=2582893 RepID=UPI0011BD716B|nr:hypothetical protein [Shimia ponticola]